MDFDGDAAHWVARGVNFSVYFVGVWSFTGRFWLALLGALCTTALAIVGYGWQFLQFFGILIAILGFMRLFGVSPI
jgi:hypothetical protein